MKWGAGVIRKLVDARFVRDNGKNTAYLIDVLTVDEERLEVWFPCAAIERELDETGNPVGDIYIETWFLPIKEEELETELKVE